MASACVKWGHALGFSGSLGEFDKLSLNFEVTLTAPRSLSPRGALPVMVMVNMLYSHLLFTALLTSINTCTIFKYNAF